MYYHKWKCIFTCAYIFAPVANFHPKTCAMPPIEFNFPEIPKCVPFLADKKTKTIKFSSLFEDEYKKGGVYVLNAEEDVQNFPQGILFDEFVASSKILKLHFLDTVFIHYFSTSSSLKFTIKRISRTLYSWLYDI